MLDKRAEKFLIKSNIQSLEKNLEEIIYQRISLESGLKVFSNPQKIYILNNVLQELNSKEIQLLEDLAREYRLYGKTYDKGLKIRKVIKAKEAKVIEKLDKILIAKGRVRMTDFEYYFSPEKIKSAVAVKIAKFNAMENESKHKRHRKTR